MTHPFTLERQALEQTQELTTQEVNAVVGAQGSTDKPQFFTTLVHGEEGGLPAEPIL